MIPRLLLALAALLLPAASLAQPPDPVATPAEALAADAASYAGLLGLDPAEALRRLQAQQDSVALTDRLAAAYRDRLAGVVIEHRPDYRIVLDVVGPPAPDLPVAVAPGGVPVVVRSGAAATRDRLLAALAAHQAELRDALPSPPGLAPDPRTGRLLVLTRPGDDDPDPADTAARLEAIAGVPVEVQSWAEAGADLAVEGGGRVTGASADDPRRFTCTAGFAVTDGRQDALATAAHCPDTLSFVDRDRTETPLILLGAWGAGSQDVQLHGAGRPLMPLFHADDPDRSRAVRAVRPRAETRAGDVVCHRGMRTGYGCALVAYPDFAPPGDLCAGPCPATWVAVAGPQCRGGDSGGPVFLGEQAFGLVKGESSSDGTCRLYYYMSLDYLPPGWAVLTAPAPPVASPLAAPPPAVPLSAGPA